MSRPVYPRSLAAYVRTFAGFGRDARLFLLTTLIIGAAISVYWIDFNLYLEALGVDRSTIGALMAVSQIAGVAVALPAAAVSDRIGRRWVIAGGAILMLVAFTLYLSAWLPLIVLGVAIFGAGSQSMAVAQVPYMAERTAPEQRNELFAVFFAIQNVTSLVAAIGGGLMATTLATSLGLSATAGPYQILLIAMIGLTLVGIATIFNLRDDRPRGERPAHASTRFGITIVNRGLFFRLLLPGFLTSLGAGQLIPYLNIFVKGKFGLDLTEVNSLFAVTALGTTAAILIQPALARRFGRIGSIVLVQTSSLPFLLVLGFSPLFWTVACALAIRNSLMNAGSPIFDSFAMGHVTEAERGTLSAAMTLLWALGWAIAGPYYGLLQSQLGFSTGYAVNFATCIVLYTISTALLWHWFRAADAREPASRREEIEIPVEVEAV